MTYWILSTSHSPHAVVLEKTHSPKLPCFKLQHLRRGKLKHILSTPAPATWQPEQQQRIHRNGFLKMAAPLALFHVDAGRVLTRPAPKTREGVSGQGCSKDACAPGWRPHQANLQTEALLKANEMVCVCVCSELGLGAAPGYGAGHRPGLLSAHFSSLYSGWRPSRWPKSSYVLQARCAEMACRSSIDHASSGVLVARTSRPTVPPIKVTASWQKCAYIHSK